MPSKSALRDKWDKAGQDVVVLHQFDRAKTSPNASPFPLKLEAYLRMADIKYVVDSKQPMSSKGKSPWITINSKDMADSQLCMEYLAKTLGKDLSAHLTREEKSIARGIRAILEDHFYFCLAIQRWKYDKLSFIKDHYFPPFAAPKFLQGFIYKRLSKHVQKQCQGQGMGLHTQEEVQQMGLQDLRCVSEYLGEKPFLMGERPTEVDCVLFGFAVQLVFGAPEGNVFAKALEEELGNLKEHCLRMKERYFADWDEMLYKEKAKEKAKSKKKDKAKEEK